MNSVASFNLSLALTQFLRHELLSFMLWRGLTLQSYVCRSFHFLMDQIQKLLCKIWGSSSGECCMLLCLKTSVGSSALSTPSVVAAVCKEKLYLGQLTAFLSRRRQSGQGDHFPCSFPVEMLDVIIRFICLY